MTAGAALVALSALGYATNPIFGKFAYAGGANAITLGAIRFTTAAVALWAFLAVTGKLRGLAWAMRLQLIALGGLGIAMVALLYFTALEHIGASLATGLFYTYPAMVVAVGLFRGDGLSRTGAMGLMLTLVGTWLLLGADLGGFTWQGALLILAAAVLYTAYIMVSDRLARGVSATVASAHMTAGAAAVYLTLALVTGQRFPTGGQPYLAGMGLALCSTVIALITFFAGLPRVGPARASIISTLEPVFTTLMAVLLLSERLNMLQTFGLGLVVTGAVAAQVKERAAPVGVEQA